MTSRLTIGVWVLIGVLAVLLPMRFVLPAMGAIWNHSDSVNGALFLPSGNQSAPYIVFCAPNAEVVRPALEKLPRGNCPGGFMPLLKPWITATPARPVHLDARGFTVDGHLMPNTAPKRMTTWRAPLTAFVFGTYTSGIWAISTDSPNSYDSRYFGPVKADKVRTKAVKVF